LPELLVGIAQRLRGFVEHVHWLAAGVAVVDLPPLRVGQFVLAGEQRLQLDRLQLGCGCR